MYDDKTVNGEYYRNKMLPIYAAAARNSAMFPRQNLVIFMQDGAPAHTAKATMNIINTEFAGMWRDWPGNSPDLNPVEHLWARLQDSVLRQPRPSNREHLIRHVKQELASITQNDICRLIESLPQKIDDCLKNEGQSTKY